MRQLGVRAQARGRSFFGRAGLPPTFAHRCLGFGGALLFRHGYLLIGCNSICCHRRSLAEAKQRWRGSAMHARNAGEVERKVSNLMARSALTGSSLNYQPQQISAEELCLMTV